MIAKNFINQMQTEFAKNANDFARLEQINVTIQKMHAIPEKSAALEKIKTDLNLLIIRAYDAELNDQNKEAFEIKTDSELATMTEDVYDRLAIENPTILKPLLRSEVTKYVKSFTDIWAGRSSITHYSSHQPK